jgi:hypothetical protein
MPWPAGIGGLIGGFAQRPPAPYVEEAAEEQTVSPPYTPPKPDAASVEPPKTEDHAIAAELGLDRDLANVDLQRIRRDFAKKNHPDRFEPARPRDCGAAHVDRQHADRRTDAAEQLSSLTNSYPRGAFIESGDFDSRRAVPPAANQNASQASTART